MRITPTITAITTSLALLSHAVGAEEPHSPLAKGRTLKLPEATATPIPEGATVIDERRLAELSRSGRIAAVGAGGDAANDLDTTPKTKPKGRAYWRSQYRKQRERVAALETRARDLEAREHDLNRKWLTAGSAQSRAAIDDQLVQVRERRRQTATDLRAANGELQRITRQARTEGATPDWFRGLR